MEDWGGVWFMRERIDLMVDEIESISPDWGSDAVKVKN